MNNRARGLVTNSRILSNTLTEGWASAGILVSDDALATLHSNEIAWNTGLGSRGPSGGIRVNANSVVTVVNNHIHSNVVENGDGGALSADGSVVNVFSNTIVSNQARCGGGLRLSNDVHATIDGNIIAENEVNGSAGGAYIKTSVVTMTNNVIASNRGDEEWNGDGVTIRSTGSNVRIVNNTIVSNTAEGIEATDGADVLVRNTILCGNNGGIHNYQSSATISVDHNARWDNGWSNVSMGSGDIAVDPLFVDAAGGDFHLQADSPCVNAGSATGAPAVDIEGTARDIAPDIGAYEWREYRIFLPAAMRNVSSSSLVEWTEKVTVTVEMTPEGPQFSTHRFCARGTDGSEHWVTLGSCDTAMLSGRACPGLCSVRARPHLGGTIPLEIDGECMTFYAGPAFDPVTYELGGGAQVTLSTESATSEGDVIVLEFVGIPCAGGVR